MEEYAKQEQVAKLNLLIARLVTSVLSRLMKRLCSTIHALKAFFVDQVLVLQLELETTAHRHTSVLQDRELIIMLQTIRIMIIGSRMLQQDVQGVLVMMVLIRRHHCYNALSIQISR
jgi:hypothetical protein